MAVFAVHELLIQIDTDPGGTPTFVEIKDMESAEITFDNNVEEWTPFDTDGWIRRLKTGQSMEVAFAGKRNFGDPGNDYVAGLAFETSTAVNTTIKITTNETVPTVITLPVVIDVSTILGGDSTGVGSLEFTAMSDGKPTVA